VAYEQHHGLRRAFTVGIQPTENSPLQVGEFSPDIRSEFTRAAAQRIEVKAGAERGNLMGEYRDRKRQPELTLMISNIASFPDCSVSGWAANRVPRAVDGFRCP
jgi:hypothetical protein